MYVKKELDKFYKYVIKQSRTNLSKKGKNDNKKLYNSLKYTVKESKNSFHSALYMEEYGIYQDKGVRGVGGVRKTTSKFKKTNNKGKLWKLKKVTNNMFKFRDKQPSAKWFKGWALKRGLSPFAVAKAVYHQGIETSNFLTRPFELAFKKLPDKIIEAYALDVEQFFKYSTNDKK